jgi:hypothetical protein
MTIAQTFLAEMNAQLALARDELAVASAAADAEAADVASARLADLTDLLHRNGFDLPSVTGRVVQPAGMSRAG